MPTYVSAKRRGDLSVSLYKLAQVLNDDIIKTMHPHLMDLCFDAVQNIESEIMTLDPPDNVIIENENKYEQTGNRV